MSLEGKVTIDIVRGHVPAVSVAFTQPGAIDRLLRGKTPVEALEIVPAVFSLCAMAQLQAAQNALDAASGVVRSDRFLAARQCLTEMESLRENALRIAMDWPRFLDEAVDARHLKALMGLVPSFRTALAGALVDGCVAREVAFDREAALAIIDTAEKILEDLVFGEPVGVWCARDDIGQLKEWAAESRTVAARLLARISQSGWDDAGATPVVPLEKVDADAVQCWLNESDAGLPTARLDAGADVPETTLLARHAQDARLSHRGPAGDSRCGLWQRIAARLVELSMLPERMRGLIDHQTHAAQGRSFGPGVGLGEVTAARGLLAHVAVVEDGRIADYRIVPPTRWNFAANGIAARVVSNMAREHSEDVLLLAELAVNAIDPCVGHTVRVN